MMLTVIVASLRFTALQAREAGRKGAKVYVWGRRRVPRKNFLFGETNPSGMARPRLSARYCGAASSLASIARRTSVDSADRLARKYGNRVI
jgi:hypothetical protein